MLSMKRLGNPINAVLKAIKEEKIEDIEQSRDKLISLALKGIKIQNQNENKQRTSLNFTKKKSNFTKENLEISRSNTGNSLNNSFNISSGNNINIFNFNNYHNNYSVNNNNITKPNNYIKKTEEKENVISSDNSLNETSSPNIKYNINNLNNLNLADSDNSNKKQLNDLNIRTSLFGNKKNSSVSLKKLASSAKKNCCSCKQSHCLKLYCECFKMGEYCLDCTCPQCFNREKYDDFRQQSINHLKIKSKHAFKSVITLDEKNNKEKHIKGCKCKNSNCQKNYCECFQNKMGCSESCKCLNCSNGKPLPTINNYNKKEEYNNNNNKKKKNNIIETKGNIGSNELISEEDFNSEKLIKSDNSNDINNLIEVDIDDINDNEDNEDFV